MEIEHKNEPFWQIGSYTIHSLDTIYQKMMYVMLRQYIDDKKQCFPSVKTLAEECSMSVAKATEVLKELEEKKIITKTSRYLESGGQTSNIYTIHDHVKVKPKQTKPKPINDSVPEFEALTADKRKEASQVNQAAQSNFTQDTSEIDISDLQLHDNTKDEASQAENRTEKVAVQTKHSTDELKKQYDYVAMISENPSKQEYIDICMDIISTTINSNLQSRTLRMYLLYPFYKVFRMFPICLIGVVTVDLIAIRAIGNCLFFGITKSLHPNQTIIRLLVQVLRVCFIIPSH